MTEVHFFTSKDAWAGAAADALGREIVRALAAAETALVAIAGGGTPGAILPLLELDAGLWPRLVFTPTDERLVPKGHEARNDARLQTWLRHVEGADRGKVAALEDIDPARAPDVVLLGFGVDRHIASLFPAGEGMASACAVDAIFMQARVTPEPLPPDAPFPRLTFTLRALVSPPRVILAASGADKKQALDAALEEFPAGTPLARLLRQQGAQVCVLVWAAGP